MLGSNGLRVLDFGCGFGQLMQGLKVHTAVSVEGVDVEQEAIDYCRRNGFVCHDANSGLDFYDSYKESFDFVIMNHVLEHLPKEEMIDRLRLIRSLLKDEGSLIVAVPNAQASTGPYWRYEDFTHTYLFTSGSLKYVLRAAGYEKIEFLDIDCTQDLAIHKRILRKLLLSVYRFNYKFWSKVTASPTHEPSPSIFSYEIKARAQ